METQISAIDPGASTKKRSKRKTLLIVTGCLFGLVATLGMTFMVAGAMTGRHTLGSVTYAQIPPNMGKHSPVWQRCGFYSEAIGDEHAVHSLEHGAVWVTYDPDLASSSIDVIRDRATADDMILASPYRGLPAPVVVSMWGRQVLVDSIDSGTLDQAISDIRRGPEVPEPDAGCDGPNLGLSGATGNPE